MNFKTYLSLLFLILVGIQSIKATVWGSRLRSSFQNAKQTGFNIRQGGFLGAAFGIAGASFFIRNQNNVLPESCGQKDVDLDTSIEQDNAILHEKSPIKEDPKKNSALKKVNNTLDQECTVEFSIGHNDPANGAKEYTYKNRKWSCRNMSRFLMKLHYVDEGTANPIRTCYKHEITHDRAIFPMIVKNPYTKKGYPYNFLWQRDVDNHKIYSELANDAKDPDLVPYFKKMALKARAIDLIFRGNRHIKSMRIFDKSQDFPEKTKPEEYILWLKNNMKKQSNL